MNVHILMHEPFEAPGAILDWAARRGHVVSYTRFYDREELPDDAGAFLIVLGGPQRPSTKDCPYFDAPAEIAFIRNAIDAGTSVLGICLGAQLIGEALGARFERSPHREVGVFPVTLTAEDDPILSGFPKQFAVGHWHGDMPGLTAGAAVLATSEGCPRQIVRYAPNVYGFQCHFEFTRESIEGMIENCGHELDGSRYVQSAEELRAADYRSMNELLFRFLDACTRTLP